jgi:hypothetical protein
VTNDAAQGSKFARPGIHDNADRSLRAALRVLGPAHLRWLLPCLQLGTVDADRIAIESDRFANHGGVTHGLIQAEVELGLEQAGAGQDRAGKLDPVQGSAGKVGTGEVGIFHIGARKIAALKIDSRQCAACKIHTLKVSIAEIQPGQIAAGVIAARLVPIAELYRGDAVIIYHLVIISDRVADNRRFAGDEIGDVSNL